MCVLVISDTNGTSTTLHFSAGNLNSLKIILAILLNVTSEGESEKSLFRNLSSKHRKLHFSLFTKNFIEFIGVTLVNSVSDLILYIKSKRKVTFFPKITLFHPSWYGKILGMYELSENEYNWVLSFKIFKKYYHSCHLELQSWFIR